MDITAELERRAIEQLGYPRRWLELGLLSVALLQKQFALYDTAGADRNREHFRFAAFTLLLEREPTDTNVTQVLELATLDPDIAMASSVLVALLRTRSLSTLNFDRVAAHPLLAPLQRFVVRERLLRRLRNEGPSSEVVTACLSVADATLQEALLEHPAVSIGDLELLRAKGASKKVRNQAAVRISQLQGRSRNER